MRSYPSPYTDIRRRHKVPDWASRGQRPTSTPETSRSYPTAPTFPLAAAPQRTRRKSTRRMLRATRRGIPSAARLISGIHGQDRRELLRPRHHGIRLHPQRHGYKAPRWLAQKETYALTTYFLIQQADRRERRDARQKPAAGEDRMFTFQVSGSSRSHGCRPHRRLAARPNWRCPRIVSDQPSGVLTGLNLLSWRAASPRFLEKEADHLAAGIWPSCVGVGPVRAAAGPCVTEAMNHPLLQNFVAACVGVHSAAVASASR
jgi:hypothetical protein